MKRRDFITLLGGAAAAWPLAVRAQPRLMWMIGFLSSRSPGESAGVVAAFRRGLSEAGFTEGENLAIAFRWAEGHYDRLSELAAELVDLRVAVLFTAGGPPSALAAKAASSTIPIVFSAVSDPIGLGLVASLNRPGGNITGMSMFSAQLGAKNLELLRELVPTASSIGYLVNPATPSAAIYLNEAVTAADALGIHVLVLSAGTEQELDEAFAAMAKSGVEGLVVSGEPFFDSQRNKIAALAARHAIPAIYTFREYVVAGGLISYGPNLPDSYRRGGIYVGRVIKGEKPTDLPVVQPTKFEMVINLRTAKALDLVIPDKVIALADEVIE